MKNFFKQLYLFFYHLTPKGKEAQYYDQALNNMNEQHVISTLSKRMLKSEINYYMNKAQKRKHLTPHQKLQLIKGKFGDQMQAAGITIVPSTLKLVDA